MLEHRNHENAQCRTRRTTLLEKHLNTVLQKCFSWYVGHVKSCISELAVWRRFFYNILHNEYCRFLFCFPFVLIQRKTHQQSSPCEEFYCRKVVLWWFKSCIFVTDACAKFIKEEKNLGFDYWVKIKWNSKDKYCR